MYKMINHKIARRVVAVNNNNTDAWFGPIFKADLSFWSWSFLTACADVYNFTSIHFFQE